MYASERRKARPGSSTQLRNSLLAGAGGLHRDAVARGNTRVAVGLFVATADRVVDRDADVGDRLAEAGHVRRAAVGLDGVVAEVALVLALDAGDAAADRFLGIRIAVAFAFRSHAGLRRLRHAAVAVGDAVATADGVVFLGASRRRNEALAGCVQDAAVVADVVEADFAGFAAADEPAVPDRIGIATLALGLGRDALALGLARVAVGHAVAAAHGLVDLDARFRLLATDSGCVGATAVRVGRERTELAVGTLSEAARAAGLTARIGLALAFVGDGNAVARRLTRVAVGLVVATADGFEDEVAGIGNGRAHAGLIGGAALRVRRVVTVLAFIAGGREQTAADLRAHRASAAAAGRGRLAARGLAGFAAGRRVGLTTRRGIGLAAGGRGISVVAGGAVGSAALVLATDCALVSDHRVVVTARAEAERGQQHQEQQPARLRGSAIQGRRERGFHGLMGHGRFSKCSINAARARSRSRRSKPSGKRCSCWRMNSVAVARSPRRSAESAASISRVSSPRVAAAAGGSGAVSRSWGGFARSAARSVVTARGRCASSSGEGAGGETLGGAGIESGADASSAGFAARCAVARA